jgi:hypothetical protein
MKPTVSIVILTLLLLVGSVDSLGAVSAFSNRDCEYQMLSMPIEHINYTISEINGIMWAKIEGRYPITILNQQGYGDMSMVYPMPPQTTNIQVTLNGQEVKWSNYTQTYPGNLHKTALGDWSMIASALENVSDSFLLEVQYEHPLEVINGSYLFLYDLNILDYLSEQSPSSTAYLTIRFETNVSDVGVYTAPVESVRNEWQPKDFNISHENSAIVLSVQMDSHYGEDLSGDMIVLFSQENNSLNATGESVWIWALILDAVLVAVIIYIKRKTIVSAFPSRKSSV